MTYLLPSFALKKKKLTDLLLAGMPVPMISPSELNWSHMLSTNTVNVPTTHLHQQQQQHQQHQQQQSISINAPQSIPTLADRLETYRQLATGRMQTSMGGAILAANTIVSQSPRAVNYTTSLVERTRDLRNWLRQAKNEHDILTGMTGGGGVGGGGGPMPSNLTMSVSASTVGTSSTIGINSSASGSGAGAGTQANL